MRTTRPLTTVRMLSEKQTTCSRAGQPYRKRTSSDHPDMRTQATKTRAHRHTRMILPSHTTKHAHIHVHT